VPGPLKSSSLEALCRLEGEVGLGLGFVLGSGVVNFGLLPPIVAFCAPTVLNATPKSKSKGAPRLWREVFSFVFDSAPIELDLLPVTRDGGFALLAFAALLLVVNDNKVTLSEALSLLLLYAAHVACCAGPWWLDQRALNALEKNDAEEAPPQEEADATAPPAESASDDAPSSMGHEDELKKGRRFEHPPNRLAALRHTLVPPDFNRAPTTVALTVRSVAPTLLGSSAWIWFLLILITKVADLLALSTRIS